MLVITYEYRCPTEKGYKQILLTKEQHKKIFKNCKIRWYDKYEYYYSKNNLIVHRFYNWKLVTLATLLMPLSFLIEGLINYKSVWKDHLTLFKQKKSGHFFTDVYYKDKKIHESVKELVIGCKVKFK